MAPYQERPLRDLHTDATLRWIGIVAQDYGIGVPDGPAAVQLRLERPGIRDEMHERRMGALAWALNSGRRHDALAVLRTLPDVQSDPDFHHRIGVLAALFADGDSATGAMSARALRGTRARGNVLALNECIRTLWLLYEQPAAVPRPEILSDEQAFARDGGAYAVPRRMCVLVRDAQWLSRTGGAEWHAAIARLDGLLATGPVRGLVDNGHSEYVHLALARLYESVGEPAQALRALRRRSRYNGWQPYLSSILRAEARLSAIVGDSAGAHRANRHHDALRAAVK